MFYGTDSPASDTHLGFCALRTTAVQSVPANDAPVCPIYQSPRMSQHTCPNPSSTRPSNPLKSPVPVPSSLPPQLKALCPDVTHVPLPPSAAATPAGPSSPSPPLLAPVLLHLEELDLAGSGVLCPRLVLPVEKLQVCVKGVG